MKITREEAIAELKAMPINYPLTNGEDRASRLMQARDIAVEALEHPERNVVAIVPCGDVISRQAVLKAIDAKAWEFCDYLISKGRNDEQKPVSHFADNLRECIGEDLPPVTPQPKTGHWIFDEILDKHYYCSECKSMGVDYWDYCPYCGCRMVEPQESEG